MPTRQPSEGVSQRSEGSIVYLQHPDFPEIVPEVAWSDAEVAEVPNHRNRKQQQADDPGDEPERTHSNPLSARRSTAMPRFSVELA